jgi:hypothetical protein
MDATSRLERNSKAVLKVGKERQETATNGTDI